MELTDIQLIRMRLQQTVFDNPYIPVLTDCDGKASFPSIPQIAFLTEPASEILYGGQAGGGKTASLLAAALQYIMIPGYEAIIFRKSFSDLEKPGGLIPMSLQWLSGKGAKYDGTFHRWYFPNDATLSFGFLQNEKQMIEDYQGSAFAFQGFDELTQFEERLYRYMFSRRRKPAGTPYPIRTRATSNPGGIGHDWVKARFIAPQTAKRGTIFIPASLDDNPGLNAREYRESLAELDPLTRAQLEKGDWDTRPEGMLFKREWFVNNYIDACELPRQRRQLRYWDLAATKLREDKKNDPDWCAGPLVSADDSNRFYIEGLEHFRDTPLATEGRLLQSASMDGTSISIRIEQEPGASSKLYIATIAQRLLAAYDVMGFPTNGLDKITRAKPFSAACQRGSVFIVRGNHVAEMMDELCAFPMSNHDDIVDGLTGGYNALFAEPELVLATGPVISAGFDYGMRREDILSGY